jgi:hypothetical protein
MVPKHLLDESEVSESFVIEDLSQRVRIVEGNNKDIFPLLGGEDAVHDKIRSYSLQHLNQPRIHAKVKQMMESGNYPGRRDWQFNLVGKDDPRVAPFVKDNWDEYIKKGWVKPV